MTKMLPRRLMLAALLAAGAASSAQAGNFVEIDAADVKFYYDADFWGAGSASVIGNSISFAISEDYDVSARSRSASGTGNGSFFDFTQLSVFAVAKTGYALNSVVTGSVQTDYTLAAGGGYSSTSFSGDIAGGTYSGGAFFGTVAEGGYSVTPDRSSTGSNSSGSYSSNISVGDGTTQYAALGVSTGLEAKAFQLGVGSVRTTVTDVNYNFAVSAVPEPESYAMMMAGIALLGFSARRRKKTR